MANRHRSSTVARRNEEWLTFRNPIGSFVVTSFRSSPFSTGRGDFSALPFRIRVPAADDGEDLTGNCSKPVFAGMRFPRWRTHGSVHRNHLGRIGRGQFCPTETAYLVGLYPARAFSSGRRRAAFSGQYNVHREIANTVFEGRGLIAKKRPHLLRVPQADLLERTIRRYRLRVPYRGSLRRGALL